MRHASEPAARTRPIRTAIVDDEDLARQGLLQILAGEGDIEIVGQYRSPAAFLRDLPKIRPDLLFLDIEMPRLNGFDVVERIRETTASSPYIVFVTAFARYAARAFDEEAIDYLMKPFDAGRLALTMARVREQTVNAPAPSSPAPRYLTRLAVKRSGRIQVLRIDDVDWLETAANYVILHVGKESHIFRSTLANLEARLDPDRFARIHSSTIVNLDRIAELQPSFDREHIVLLRDGVRLRLSANYRHRLQTIVDGL